MEVVARVAAAALSNATAVFITLIALLVCGVLSVLLGRINDYYITEEARRADLRRRKQFTVTGVVAVVLSVSAGAPFFAPMTERFAAKVIANLSTSDQCALALGLRSCRPSALSVDQLGDALRFGSRTFQAEERIKHEQIVAAKAAALINKQLPCDGTGH